MSDKLESYYTDHWAEVEPERMARYEKLFQWRDSQEVLIAPADIGLGQTVVDYGCGPGGLAIELARRVGDQGKVLGLDINEQFLEKTLSLAVAAGLGDRVETRLMSGETLPLESRSVDRVISKNVLEYVPDPAATIREFHRVLKPGGLAHVTDSDWLMAMVEPLAGRFRELIDAASIAFRTPQIGRQLYGLFRQAGFRNIQVRVLCNPDNVGGLRPVLHNMAGYAKLSGRLDDSVIAEFLVDIDLAIQNETYLALLPQFLVTGEASH